MNEARMAVMQALMQMMQRRQMMPPAKPEYKYGINGAPLYPHEPHPPLTPSVGVRG